MSFRCWEWLIRLFQILQSNDCPFIVKLFVNLITCLHFTESRFLSFSQSANTQSLYMVDIETMCGPMV